jgi:uncharacterized membrane protein
MSKTRLEAFSDGVLAIILTIMVLELKVPHHGDWESLQRLAPAFLSYVLSFVYVGIYWNNHHHLLQAAECVNGRILWANLHLLFWLSLIPFVSAWMGENQFGALPIALYGVVLLCSGAAYYILSKELVAQHGQTSPIARAIGQDHKGAGSLAAYAVALLVAYFLPWLSLVIYALVALVWLIPDPRIERALDVEKCAPQGKDSQP